MVKGFYHSKLSFGTVDGPGIRYVLFLAGCQMGCAFCHNPDTWAKGQQLITAEEVLQDVEDYRQFYDSSGGGITISGGEPLLQPEFVADLLGRAKARGLHTAIDTCGLASKEAIMQVLPHVDRVLFSLKGSTEGSYQALTKAGLQDILGNLRLIAARKPVTLRYVLIPGYTDGKDSLSALIGIVRALPQTVELEVLPYHTMGIAKWDELGWDYTLQDVPEPAKGEVDAFRQSLRQAGIRLAATEN
ncbi:pyruvate formate lyase activating enzyme [Selenomonas ruminantium]|uniref:Pyruvate formate-lyase-activating enzyme n=1 Tax=Selenomonas ruminantium TaxID=971 RepID=A0A1M6VLH9_SELRU|nr:pyruvate formate-lyase-activating protein [Selenomonas ruminantium]SHK82096.1 pyruvate formate lyase activating enzyme [Selenomonas ruminantium]